MAPFPVAVAAVGAIVANAFVVAVDVDAPHSSANVVGGAAARDVVVYDHVAIVADANVVATDVDVVAGSVGDDVVAIHVNAVAAGGADVVDVAVGVVGAVVGVDDDVAAVSAGVALDGVASLTIFLAFFEYQAQNMAKGFEQ